MLLHFIFVVKKEDVAERSNEFEYAERMSCFFQSWIQDKFARDVDVQCDIMPTDKRSLLQRLDTHTLLADHRNRGNDVFHFYMCHFRPTWTDCTCEGYYAENFGMVFRQKRKKQNYWMFLAERNCTTVSHELAHEILRQAGHKKHAADIHDIWTKHLFAGLHFEQYDSEFKRTTKKPMFLAIDLSSLNYRLPDGNAP